MFKNNSNKIVEIKVIDYIKSNQEFKDEYRYLYLSSIDFNKIITLIIHLVMDMI